MGENGDEYDEWDVCDERDACHDAAAESPGPRIMLDLRVIECNRLLNLTSSHTPRLGDPPH